MQHAAWTYTRLNITTIAIIVMARMTNNINPPRVPPTMAPTDFVLSLLCLTACGMCTCMLHEYEYMSCSRYREIIYRAVSLVIILLYCAIHVCVPFGSLDGTAIPIVAVDPTSEFNAKAV